jgi:hypothetical protein
VLISFQLPPPDDLLPGVKERKPSSRDMDETILKLFKVLEVDEGKPAWDKKYKNRTSYKIEYASRILFPIAFLVFNIFYWSYYVEAG